MTAVIAARMTAHTITTSAISPAIPKNLRIIPRSPRRPEPQAEEHAEPKRGAPNDLVAGEFQSFNHWHAPGSALCVY